MVSIDGLRLKLHGSGSSSTDAKRATINVIQIPASLKRRIVEKIQDNRLTILVGPTGCGKSTLVPQLLLEEIGAPILCTQPRRLAVVAVASHVADQRHSTVGQEVGFQVGQSRVASNSTALLFSTAGILLEELRSNGIDALTKYKVVIIDECHERSPESDLCLTIIKAFMKAHPRSKLRVVLMSATFDHGKYTSYFQGVPGCEFVDTITLQTAEGINDFHKQVETLYLEDIMKRMIPRELRLEYLVDFELKMRMDPMLELMGIDKGKSLSDSLLMLILILVMKLHHDEDDDAIFLIFAPTYRHLEQIHEQLITLESQEGLPLEMNVLHSSIDIEDCVRSMKQRDEKLRHDESTYDPMPKPRRILLASAIADSSITIPGVTCIIDTCRALEVKWDADLSRYIPRTTWASKAICDQRRGRTGRTCPGRVFRLLNESHYINHLGEYEEPKLQMVSCRDEILSLLSSGNKVMYPVSLLSNCLDPPPEETIHQAIQYLKDIGACREELTSSRSRRATKLVPTDLGKLFAALPFTVDDSKIIIRGARSGLLHEALVLVAISSTRPHPIVHAFGESDYNEEILMRYFNDVDPKDTKSVAIANFAAYLFWNQSWNKIRNQACRQRFLECTGVHIFDQSSNDFYERMFPDVITRDDQNAHDCNVWDWTIDMDDAHIKWCKDHHINPTSVRAIAQSIDVTMKTLYHSDFEHEWLRCQEAEASWNLQGLPSSGNNYYDVFDFTYSRFVERIVGIEQLKELQNSFADDLVQNATKDQGCFYVKKKMACIHFLQGNCKYGERCKNEHSFSAPRPPCHFHLTTGCTNPNCLYAHGDQQVENASRYNHDRNATVPPTHGRFEGGPLSWFEMNSHELLMLGEGDFSFSRALDMLGSPVAVSTTNSTILTSNGISAYCNMTSCDATRFHINQQLERHRMLGKIRCCAWNFPFADQDDNDKGNESLVCGAFMSIAHYFNDNTEGKSRHFEFGLTLQGNQLSRWSVLRSARRAGFHLVWWDEFDPNEFPGYLPKRDNGDAFQAQNSRFYLFRLNKTG